MEHLNLKLYSHGVTYFTYKVQLIERVYNIDIIEQRMLCNASIGYEQQLSYCHYS